MDHPEVKTENLTIMSIGVINSQNSNFCFTKGETKITLKKPWSIIIIL